MPGHTAITAATSTTVASAAVVAVCLALLIHLCGNGDSDAVAAADILAVVLLSVVGLALVVVPVFAAVVLLFSLSVL